MSELENSKIDLTDNERAEMNDLRKAIAENISSVPHEKLERFTNLFVRSLNFVS